MKQGSKISIDNERGLVYSTINENNITLENLSFSLTREAQEIYGRVFKASSYVNFDIQTGVISLDEASVLKIKNKTDEAKKKWMESTLESLTQKGFVVGILT